MNPPRIRTILKERMTFLLFITQIFNLNAQYSGGSGSVADPYQISSMSDLVTLSATSSDWNKHFVQINDIDASSTLGLNGNTGFMPIGSDPFAGGTAFTGTYNGLGNSITGLFIRRPNTDSQAMFGYLGGSSRIEELSLLNDSISGRDRVGGLAAYSLGGSISNCFVQGFIKGRTSVGGLVSNPGNGSIITGCHTNVIINSSYAAGGLIGRGGNITVSNCYSNVIITSSGSGNTMGGFIGQLDGGKIDNCFSRGKINAGNVIDIGGFVGATAYTTLISNCYSMTDVNGSDRVGGFAGKLGLVSTAGVFDTIRNCYSIGLVNSSGTKGGFAGSCVQTKFYSVYWNSEIVNNPILPGLGQFDDSSGVYARTTQALRNESTFNSWDFTNVWKMGQCSNKGYPVFTWENIETGSFPYSGINYSNGILTALDDLTTYQWVDCSDNYSSIIGETNQSFSPINNGSYALIVFNSAQCTDTSECIVVSDADLGVEENMIDRDLYTLYPNPTTGKLFIEGITGDASVEIYDLNGKLLLTEKNISPEGSLSIEALQGKIFIVKITENGRSMQQRIVKL